MKQSVSDCPAASGVSKVTPPHAPPCTMPTHVPGSPTISEMTSSTFRSETVTPLTLMSSSPTNSCQC
eukprot:517396-Rhodomonas_salina.2